MARFLVLFCLLFVLYNGCFAKLPEILTLDDASQEILFLDLYKRVSALETKTRMSDAIDWTQQSQFDTLKALAENQQAWLKDLETFVRAKDRCPGSSQQKKSAFSAYLSKDMGRFSSNLVVVFDQVILNEGGHYSNETGIYRCPWDGVYDFTVFIGQRSDSAQHYGVWTRLEVNGELVVMAVVDQYHKHQDLQGGNRVIMRLQEGDQVKVVGEEGSEHIEGNAHRSTTFSGLFLYE